MLPGYLPHMNSTHIDTFLAALDLSQAAALKFDSRPGLKFLVQKVANLDQAANLYQQAGAAWTVKVVTLFELCLDEISNTGADVDTVKRILEVDEKTEEDEERAPEKQRLSKYLKELKTTFDKLCEMYVEVVVDKDGKHSRVDQFSSQSVFFLVAQPDDYPEIKGKEISESRTKETVQVQDSAGIDSVETNFAESTSDVTHRIHADDMRDSDSPDDDEIEIYNPNLDDESGPEELGLAENEARPFRLSDLAVEYSTDSGPESEPESEIDDSRPASRLGSINDRIPYLDQSRESSREGYVDAVTDEEIMNRINSLAPSRLDHADFKEQGHGSSKHRASHRLLGKTTLLSRQNSLKFVFGQGDEDRVRDSPPLRSQSVMELCKSSGIMRGGNSPRPRPSRSVTDSPKSRSTSKASNCSQLQVSSRMLDHPSCDGDPAVKGAEDHQDGEDKVTALLDAYKRSKIGLRTNPFFAEKNVEETRSRQLPVPPEVELQRKNSIFKDSEAHCRAWAEILSAALQWASVLPVSLFFSVILLRAYGKVFFFLFE